MRKRAFTLIELLVVIAIIAILAAILFPVFAQAKTAAKKATDLSNQKQYVLGIMQYSVDQDDTYPMAVGKTQADGIWRVNYNHYVPNDYPEGPGGGAGTDGSYAIRMEISRFSWANNVQPYVKNYDIFPAPGTSPVSAGGASNALPATGKVRKNTSHTFNGLLHTYPVSDVAAPGSLPIYWNGRGAVQSIGAALANPMIACATANAPCRFRPIYYNGSGWSCVAGNGGSGMMFGVSGTVWMYGKGSNFAFADGHAKFRTLGAAIAPGSTDASIDPWTGYNAAGIPPSYWYDGCHAWLFRPQYEP